ncbi:MAG: SURF1 family protein [Gammaproteobacteria bacterium]|nr:MAG: SURF1 family protein [Gammaproteobacteria bacterium]
MRSSFAFKYSMTLSRLALSLLVLLLVALFVRLGYWQLDRAARKEHLAAVYAQRAQDPPLVLDNPVKDAEKLRFQHVIVEGTFDTHHVIFLDNKVYQGRPGFEVLTPFLVEDSRRWLLVDRGWVPQGMSREVLPPVTTPPDRVKLTGVLNPPPEEGLILGEVDTPGWPKVVQRIDLERLSQQLGHPLEPVIVYLDPSSPYGFTRAWHAPGRGIERHKAYAFQWFAMAAGLLILYAVLLFRRKKPVEGNA